ncbi:hypothetical protein [Streptomyces sp. NPDC056401]|uniref:hypothetical protein n=1 Tax=Streptomyces sp. NPDC056401 TaxID=3345809 RepID=UPI0035D5B3B0
MASRTVSWAESLALGLGVGLPLPVGDGEGVAVAVAEGVGVPSPLGGALDTVGPACEGCSPVSRATNHTVAAPIASAATATAAVVGVSHRPPARGGGGCTGYTGCPGCGCGYAGYGYGSCAAPGL